MFTLLATLLIAQPAADTSRSGPAAAPSPPIQITLNSGGNYQPGGLVNVRIETNDDGYLLVFRVDADGRIRVLFPLDPDADAFVRGGKEYEIRGRGDRGTFFADDRGGTGMVYAALARQSYRVSDVSANGHWDYDRLRLTDSTTDAENDLTVIVSRMTNRARFDYDAVGYRVQDIASATEGVGGGGVGYYPALYDPFYNPAWRCLGCGWGYPGADIAVGFGYSPFWDPWLFSPWGFSYGYGFGYGYTGSNWWYGRNYPIGRAPRPAPPAGTRVRPREPQPQGGTHVTNTPPPSSGQPNRGRTTTSAPPAPPPTHTPPASTGTRSRPRPSDEAMVPTQTVSAPGNAAPYVRPVFRQPQPEMPVQPVQPRQESPPPQARPVYREPPQPQVNRTPPPPPPAPSPQPRSAPTSPPPAPSVRPAPPPASGGATTSRPRPGGGGR
ncbi:MAG: DUF4384 domain-containing protein [Gemmatimonadota bacterium]